MSSRCPVCRRILTAGDPPHCRPCNTPTSFEYDEHGVVLRAWNNRHQIVFMARASHRLNDTGPQRVRTRDGDSPLDGWLPAGIGRLAQLKERRTG